MRAVYFLFGIFLTIPGIAQSVNDTLRMAQQLVQQKELIKAVRLLEVFHETNQDPLSYQLHAQLLYNTKQYRKALTFYQKAVQEFPTANFLTLDYGRTLFQLGRLKMAAGQLERYTQNDSLHAESHVMLAYIDTWQGNASAAWRRMKQLKKHYPDDRAVKDLLQYYERTYSNSIGGGYTFLSDDQPLQSSQFRAAYTAYYAPLLSPFISASFAQFSHVPKGVNTAWVQAGNLWQFGFGRIKLKTVAGIFSNRQTGSLPTGELSLRQKLSPAISLELAAIRQPYQFTVSSIANPFLYHTFSGSLQFDRKQVMGSAGGELQRFDDGNNITTVYAWTLIPLIRLNRLSLKAGYNYSYSNADHSSFTPAKKAHEAAQSQPAYTQVQGYYVPYFTPTNQQVHALLTNFTLRLHPDFRIQGNTSYGFLANADNPYLLLEQRGSDLFISRNFYRQRYTPVEAEIGIETPLSSSVSMQLKYRYSRLFFYTRNLASLYLTYRFTK